jgi:hypothetical protein
VDCWDEPGKEVCKDVPQVWCSDEEKRVEDVDVKKVCFDQDGWVESVS